MSVDEAGNSAERFQDQTFYRGSESLIKYYKRPVVQKIGFGAVVGWLDPTFF